MSSLSLASRLVLIFPKGTRIFIATHLLKNVAAQPSAVYDVESFFWTFLYTLLNAIPDKFENKDTQLLKQLVPDSTRDYMGDAAAKSLLLLDLLDNQSVALHDIVLEPYQDYIAKLALVTFDLNRKTMRMGFAGYDLQAELGVIQEYISTFEMLLKELQQKTTSG